MLMVSQKKQMHPYLSYIEMSKVGKKKKPCAYFSLVRPQLEYAAAIWDPYMQMYKNKIEMVQKRASRYVCNNYSGEINVTTVLNHLNFIRPYMA